MRFALCGRAVAAMAVTALFAFGQGAAAQTEAQFSEIDAGPFHICGVDLQGDTLCWGANDNGQLGRGRVRDRSLPGRVRGVQMPAMAITAGESHSCVTEARGIRCWGRNAEGQLGTGDFAFRLVGTRTLGVRRGLAALSAGIDHSCSLTESGAMRCWGGNAGGQLGDGTQVNRARPVPVAGLARPQVQIGTGWQFTCARDEIGAVQCWGDNRDGRLGDGSGQNSTAPVGVTGLGQDVRQLSVGIGHACIVDAGQEALCWGSNDFGQIGDGNPGEAAEQPTPVVALPWPVAAVEAGGGHSCAIVAEDRVVWCWGWNIHGQLGDGTLEDSLVPVAVQGLPAGVVSLTLGDLYSCALMDDGRAFCWGSNDRGQLGRGGGGASPVPQPVLRP